MAVTAAAEAMDEFRSAFADEEAFRKWYDATLPRVYGFVASRCGGPGPLAEELTQLAFVEATRRHSAFDGRSDVVTWLCAIARHKLADHYRHLERDERRHMRLVVREIPVVGDHVPATEERDAIERAMRTLPAAQRAALIFRHLDGLSIREIGDLLGKSDTAIESLLARGRQRFRSAYERQTRD